MVDVKLSSLWRLALLGLAGCAPDLSVPTWHITAPRLLAVQVVPAEASPGASVQLRALVALPDAATAAQPEWHLCTQRKRDDELGPVAQACLDEPGLGHVALGSGDVQSLAVPGNACSLFGPDLPPQVGDEPAGRPVDPDRTGGYWLPLRVALGAGPADLAQVRLRCGIAGATQAQASQVNRQWRANANPELGLQLAVGDQAWQSVAADAPTVGVQVPAGGHLRLRVTPPACPQAAACGDGVCDPDDDVDACPQDCAVPLTCHGAERYAVFDPEAKRVEIRSESLRVTWFATGGALSRTVADPAVASDSAWTPPSGWTAGAHARLWVVLRDDRGGVAWQTIEVSAP